jgi:4-carboxymuconolactone decarboxylase
MLPEIAPRRIPTTSRAAPDAMRHLLIIVVLAGLPSLLSQQSAAQDSSRFPALRLDQLTPEQKKWADDIAAPPRNAKFINPPYNEYIRSPELAARATAFAGYLRWNTSLSPRLSEFAILIAARQWTQQYEWHQHYPLAIKGGLDPKILADIVVGKRPGELKDDERILYDFVTQIYRNKNVSDVTFDAAVAKFGERGVMDLIGIVGYYDFVSMTLIAANAAPPKDDVPVLQPFPK